MKRHMYVLVCIIIFQGCLVCYQPVNAMDTGEINLSLIVSDKVKMQKKVEVKCLDQTNDNNVIFENKDYKFGAFFHPNSVRIRHWQKIKNNNYQDDWKKSVAVSIVPYIQEVSDLSKTYYFVPNMKESFNNYVLACSDDIEKQFFMPYPQLYPSILLTPKANISTSGYILKNFLEKREYQEFMIQIEGFSIRENIIYHGGRRIKTMGTMIKVLLKIIRKKKSIKFLNDWPHGLVDGRVDGYAEKEYCYHRPSQGVRLSILSVKPGFNTKNVPIDTKISVTFSEPINTLTVNQATFIMQDKGKSEAIIGAYEVEGNTVLFKPLSNLDYGKRYNVTIKTGLKSQAGKSMKKKKTWAFFTTVTKAEPITFEASLSVPKDKASDISVNTSITVTFSKKINPDTINKETFIVNDGARNIEGKVIYKDKRADFIPDNQLYYNRRYNITITTGIKDKAKNSLKKNKTWAFKTESEPDTIIWEENWSRPALARKEGIKYEFDNNQLKYLSLPAKDMLTLSWKGWAPVHIKTDNLKKNKTYTILLEDFTPLWPLSNDSVLQKKDRVPIEICESEPNYRVSSVQYCKAKDTDCISPYIMRNKIRFPNLEEAGWDHGKPLPTYANVVFEKTDVNQIYPNRLELKWKISDDLARRSFKEIFHKELDKKLPFAVETNVNYDFNTKLMLFNSKSDCINAEFDDRNIRSVVFIKEEFERIQADPCMWATIARGRKRLTPCTQCVVKKGKITYIADMDILEGKRSVILISKSRYLEEIGWGYSKCDDQLA